MARQKIPNITKPNLESMTQREFIEELAKLFRVKIT